MYALTVLSVALVRESDLKINIKCNINIIKKRPDESTGGKKDKRLLSPKIKSLLNILYNNIKTKYNRFIENIYSEKKINKGEVKKQSCENIHI